MIPSLLALRIESIAVVDVWQQLGGWFVTGVIASLLSSLLIRRKQLPRKGTSLSQDNAQSAVSSVPLSQPADSMKTVARALDVKYTPPPITAMRNHGSDKARTGLQVMNGLFLLFCGYILLTGHSGFVSDLLDFVFLAAFALGFLAAANPKHDTKRKLAKWLNIAAAALVLLIALASATAGAATGLIGGIVLGLPALINIWAVWRPVKVDSTEGPEASVEECTGDAKKAASGVPKTLSRSPVFRKRAASILAIIAILVIGLTAVVQYQNKRGGTIDLVSLANKTSDAVVLIQVFDSAKNEIATGSGFFVSPDGLLITNWHVVEEAASAAAKTKSGQILPIKGAIGLDRENDLAVLMVEGANLPFLTLGQSGVLKTGDRVAVIGSPIGLEGSLSEGIVSAKRQWLQITAPISPGSSGSPVFDAKGSVIGVATKTLRAGQSLNFAVPAELVTPILKSFERGQKPVALTPLEETTHLYALANAIGREDAESAVRDSPEYEQALRAFYEAMAASNYDAAAQLAGAAGVPSSVQYQRADWGKVLTATNALVAKYPDSGVAYAELGNVYEQMGFSEDAIGAYQRAVHLRPDDAGSWHSLGEIYKQNDKITQANFAFSQAIAILQKQVESEAPGPGKSTSLRSLGDSYRSAGNNEAAKQSYLQAIQADPNGLGGTLSMYPLAGIYLTEGNEKAAFDIAYRIYAGQPKPEAEAWGYLEKWYADHHRDADSMRCFLNAARLGLKR